MDKVNHFSDSGGESVNVDAKFKMEHLLCGRHGEPFRENWPLGYSSFFTIGFDRLLEKEEIQKECKGQLEDLDKLLEVKPLCCRLPSSELFTLYEDVNKMAKVWYVKLCSNCARFRFGGPYRVGIPGGIHWFKHLCMSCVIFKGKLK